jgi:hypothetical protein
MLCYGASSREVTTQPNRFGATGILTMANNINMAGSDIVDADNVAALNVTLAAAGVGGSTVTVSTGSTPTTVGQFALSGTAVVSGSAGGNSGQHLQITLNGVPYKIALLNP